jgi:hypothetical protein
MIYYFLYRYNRYFKQQYVFNRRRAFMIISFHEFNYCSMSVFYESDLIMSINRYIQDNYYGLKYSLIIIFTRLIDPITLTCAVNYSSVVLCSEFNYNVYILLFIIILLFF